ncbi:hypothetical protein GmHk_20G057444 [Glycine max]|nr:hypothetical protein GmHk_20G057444 [Glycine max]
MVESERLSYIRNNKTKLRVDKYYSLQTSLDAGSSKGSSKGKRVILPSTFVGSPRYMDQLYFDGMAICSHLTIADMHTIEFQKRGLPHVHLLLFLHPDNKYPSLDDIDHIISVEIPSHENDPELYTLDQNHMVHGPCGILQSKSPCMKEGKCSRFYPKMFHPQTVLDSNGYPIYHRRNDGRTISKNGVIIDNRYIVPYNGYPIYHRRNDGRTISKNGVIIDNRYIVPYNAKLLRKYQAHINIEWCNQNTSIKYLFKYINKGYDRVTAVVIHDANGTLENTITQNDEIKEYVDRRYISPCEATWRIFGFPIHARKPAVERLHFHLPGQHNVVYEDDDDIDDILSKPSISDSKFLAWMNSNKCFSEELHIDDEQLKNLTLLEIEKLLHANQKSLRDYPTMPYLEGANPASCLENSLILSELNYNNDEARSEFENLFLSMTDIGDGVIGNQNDGYATIEIPEYLLIIEYNDPIDAIVKSTFTDLYQYHSNPEFFKSRAILASTNETVEEMTNRIIRSPLIIQFIAAFNSDKNTIQLLVFYHTQWAPHYPEFVHLRYNGAIYEIRVRQHKDKVYLAYGLQNFRKDLKIYESTNINFFACDHHSVFDIHFIPPLERQTCGRQRHSSRKHIWTLQLTQEMLDDPEPLKLPHCTEVPLKACGNHMTVLRRHGPPLQWKVETLNPAIGGKGVVQPWYDFLEEMNFDDGDEISIYYRYYEKIWDIIIRTQEDWEDSDNN